MANTDPTYEKLISLLEVAETKTDVTSAADVLVAKFCLEYPSNPIGQPVRFLDTVRRIAAPTRPSAHGPPKLEGSPLRFYLRRRWAPRVRHVPQGQFQYSTVLLIFTI